MCVCVYTYPHHRRQDWQEERGSGNVASTLGEDGDEEAEDDSDGPGRDGVEGCHLRAQPAGQSGHLRITHTQIIARPLVQGHQKP